MTRHVLALIAAALTFGLLGQLPAGAAEASAVRSDLRVGHTVKRIVVPGSTQGESRQVDVHLWYPADKRSLSAAPKTRYTSALNGEELIPARWDPLSWTIEAEIAREDAAIDRHGKAFPVVVFSHGSTNDPIDYAYTLELIAGEGFVVAAPYHVNNTQDDVRIDFINAQAGRQLFPCNDGRPAPCSRTNVPRSMDDRVRDIGAILDNLPGWFGDRVDVSRAGVLGHSRGTVTALAAAGGSSQWGFGPLEDGPGRPRVKAVMGMAIGAPAITFGVDLANVSVPAVLVAGGLDQTSLPTVSEAAFDAISSEVKAFVTIKHATHRSFDSTYCAQMQAAGGIAVENGGRAILDMHTVTGIAASPPMGLSGKAVHYCSRDFFTKPVDIRTLVGNIPGSEFEDPPRVGPPSVCIVPKIPCTGLDTDVVKRAMKELAVAFFGKVLRRVGG
jgi:predicted dienelactone hydrolase